MRKAPDASHFPVELVISPAPCAGSSHPAMICFGAIVQGPYPAMIMKEDNPFDLHAVMRKAPGASHSRGRVVLVSGLSPATSLSGLLRRFEGFHLQEHAATLIEPVRSNPLPAAYVS